MPLTKRAPAAVASKPGAETPPDVPAGTACQLVMRRGGAAARVPISVPQVSAAEAASAPAPSTDQPLQGATTEDTAARANIPPLARTWAASRAPPLATTLEVRRSFT